MSDPRAVLELNKVIEPYLDGGTVLKYSSQYLTKPGDNFGSILLSIEAKVRTKSGNIEEIPLVAKIPPITNEVLWKMFQPERTCLTENAVYLYLAPAFKQLQLEAGIKEPELYDGFAKYYGSRISMDANATKVDKTAALVMENLQNLGFRPGNRHKIFDLPHTRLVLPLVAKFHALTIALRTKKPDEFNRNIRPFFRRLNLKDVMSEEERTNFEKDLLADVAVATENNEAILERVKELIQDYNTLLNSPEKQDDPYTTVVHFDMWINNFMIKYDELDLPCKAKLIDFQMAEYESVIYDLVFFMFSSVETEVLDYHTNELFLLYYYSFVKCLDNVRVSTKEYSFEGFMQEVHKYAPVAICVSLFMSRVILVEGKVLPKTVKDMDIKIGSKKSSPLRIQRIADVIRLAQKFNMFFKR